MRKYIVIAALAFALVMGMTIAPASAYFTDQHTANGGVPVAVGPDTNIYEWVHDTTKTVAVQNKEDSVPVFVRVQSEYPEKVMTETVTFENESDWEFVDGWYVYQHALAPGAQTSKIDFKYDFEPVKSMDPKHAPEDGNNYNVVVTYEAVPANISPLPDYASWAEGLDPSTQGGN